MTKTKIDWANYSWNPIKGLCPEACWYCYGRAMYHRFKWPAELSWDQGDLEKYGPIPKGSRIFVCSTMELFHPAIPESWRRWIFEDIEKHPDLTFIILTKRPERIDRAMPPNVWLGVSVTGAGDWHLVRELQKTEATIRFVSLEPLFGPTPPIFQLPETFDWLIIGRMTGHGKKHDPRSASIHYLVDVAKYRGIPVFLKNNLRDIWPGPLIQEYPDCRAD